ncbi:MAG: UMP kinase [Lachnospiraceae bacterium]|nr:UMP kinase [Lachnospiraceae bacterium]
MKHGVKNAVGKKAFTRGAIRKSEVCILGKYQRILLKLSGEALAGEKKTGFDEPTCMEVAKQIRQLVDNGTQVAIVIGGGNFWRGRSSETIDRTKADSIGMLATVMNCIYMSEICRCCGMETAIFTPFACGTVSELFSKDKAVAAMKQGTVIFLAGGTGHPYFSTDTATSLRAVQLDCDAIVMARAVDGVYTGDPKTDPTAVKYTTVTYQELLDRKLKVLDLTATVMCMENNIPTLVFSLNEENSIVNNVSGNNTGTIVTV